MSNPIQANRFDGPARLSIRLESLHAKDNPELLGRAEYLISFKVAGLERWQSPKPIRVGEGGTVPVGGEVEVEIDAETDYLDIEVHAAEQDLLSADDHARGHLRIYRSGSFETQRGFVVPIEGAGTKIELHCSVALKAL